MFYTTSLGTTEVSIVTATKVVNRIQKAKGKGKYTVKVAPDKLIFTNHSGDKVTINAGSYGYKALRLMIAK